MNITLSLQYIVTQSLTLNSNTLFQIGTGNLLSNWTPQTFEIDFRNVISYNNVQSFALLSSNAYNNVNDTDWEHVNDTQRIPKDLSNDTVVAYLFSDDSLKNHVIAIKGTTTKFDLQTSSNDEFLGDNKETVANDRFNDNLFFSCCFYKQSKLFNDLIQQSNCTASQLTSKTCSKQCYTESTNYTNNYKNNIDNIISLLQRVIDIPSSQIIVTGHSLGGVLATFLGISINKPVVTFESPGELHYLSASNMFPPSSLVNRTNIYHFGHTGDTIFTGKCKGIFSTCFWGGYVIRTTCHVGHTCSYDSVGKLGVKESVLTHRLKWIIQNIMPHWKHDFPNCTLDPPCKDCSNWTIL